MKTRENDAGLHYLVFDNFDFTRKLKNAVYCQKKTYLLVISGQMTYFFTHVNFLIVQHGRQQSSMIGGNVTKCGSPSRILVFLQIIFEAFVIASVANIRVNLAFSISFFWNNVVPNSTVNVMNDIM